MSMISTKQLREDFPAIRDRLRAGEGFLLIYRSQPLAEIKPVAKPFMVKEGGESYGDTGDKLKQVKRLAGGFKFDKDLSPDEMNELYDKQYEQMLS